MQSDDWTAQMRLRGIPDSHHRMMLDSRPENKIPVGVAIVAVLLGCGAFWVLAFLICR